MLPHLFSRLGRAYGRRAARWFARREHGVELEQPLITFTFDDFPRSALHVAGKMLEAEGVAGTYFTSFGLMGKTAPTGQIFLEEDLPLLFAGIHEVGCHTYDHFPAWETPTADYTASVERNAEALKRLAPRPLTFVSHSFPINFPRVATKRWLATRFQGCRAGGQTHNHQRLDFGHINSFFLEQSVHHPEAIREAIDANTKDCGWLIFSTHDVSDTPTRYGCTPSLFADTLKWSLASGAKIVTMAGALATIAPENQK